MVLGVGLTGFYFFVESWPSLEKTKVYVYVVAHKFPGDRDDRGFPCDWRVGGLGLELRVVTILSNLGQV